MTARPDSPAGLSFELDVRPMFRDEDHDSGPKHIDLWSSSDVRSHQVLSRLRDDTMACDEAWPPELRQWMADGAG